MILSHYVMILSHCLARLVGWARCNAAKEERADNVISTLFAAVKKSEIAISGLKKTLLSAFLQHQASLCASAYCLRLNR